MLNLCASLTAPTAINISHVFQPSNSFRCFKYRWIFVYWGVGFFYIYINIYISTVSWYYKEHKAHLQLLHVQPGWDLWEDKWAKLQHFPSSGGHLGGSWCLNGSGILLVAEGLQDALVGNMCNWAFMAPHFPLYEEKRALWVFFSSNYFAWRLPASLPASLWEAEACGTPFYQQIG